MIMLQDGGLPLLEQELGFVLLLSIAALVAIVIRRIRLPYTVALVLAGLILSFFPNFLHLEISSELILAILVPPLVFEATMGIQWSKLRQDLGPVVLLAVVGSVLGTLIVGLLVKQFLEIPLAAAMAFGALISATDPVAVIAFFRTLGVSKRLSLLVEGESLFNDGVAIVLFKLALAAAVSGSGSFNAVTAVANFFTVAFGGLGIGLVLGFAVSYLILRNVDDHLIETATTVSLAFGAYLLAEEFHVSGILAVVAAGLMVGNIGSISTSPTTRLTLNNFWEFMAFVGNSIVFLLIGLEIQINQLKPNLVPVIVAVVAILLSRAVIIYSLASFYNRIEPARYIPRRFRHVMFWGGLRGAISLALALTLTGNTFGYAVSQQLRVMTFAVVLFTLMVQGTTIEPVIRWLRLAVRPEPKLEQERRQARFFARRAGKRELEKLHNDGILFRDVWEAMAVVYDQEINKAKQSLREHFQDFPELEQEMLLEAREEVLLAERIALGEAARHGFISERVYHELLQEVDIQIAANELIRTQQETSPSTDEERPAAVAEVKEEVG